MLVHGLQNAERPAEPLAHQAIGINRSLGVSERLVFILDAISVAEQGHSEISVLRYGVGLVVANLANRGSPPCTNSSGDHTHRAERVQGAAFKILAGDVLESLPTCPQVHPVTNFGIAGDGSDFWIKEVGHQK